MKKMSGLQKKIRNKTNVTVGSRDDEISIITASFCPRTKLDFARVEF